MYAYVAPLSVASKHIVPYSSALDTAIKSHPQPGSQSRVRLLALLLLLLFILVRLAVHSFQQNLFASNKETWAKSYKQEETIATTLSNKNQTIAAVSNTSSGNNNKHNNLLLSSSLKEATAAKNNVSTNIKPAIIVAHLPNASVVNHDNNSNEAGGSGTWTKNNTWIPPIGWKLYSQDELRDFYRNKSILWIGDSTARRTAMTLYALLEFPNASFLTKETLNSPSLLDITKRGGYSCDKWQWMTMPGENNNNKTNIGEFRPSVCRWTNQGSTFISHLRLNCLGNLQTFLEHELQGQTNVTADADLVVVALGLHDVIRAGTCPPVILSSSSPSNVNATTTKNHKEMAAQVVQQLNALTFQRSNTQHREHDKKPSIVVWRSSGYSDHGPHMAARVDQLNGHIQNEIARLTMNQNNHSSSSFPVLTYLDWATVIRPRSFGPNRIQGDILAHYGMEARLALLQMLTNHLCKVEQLQQQGMIMSHQHNGNHG